MSRSSARWRSPSIGRAGASRDAGAMQFPYFRRAGRGRSRWSAGSSWAATKPIGPQPVVEPHPLRLCAEEGLILIGSNRMFVVGRSHRLPNAVRSASRASADASYPARFPISARSRRHVRTNANAAARKPHSRSRRECNTGVRWCDKGRRGAGHRDAANGVERCADAKRLPEVVSPGGTAWCGR